MSFDTGFKRIIAIMLVIILVMQIAPMSAEDESPRSFAYYSDWLKPEIERAVYEYSFEDVGDYVLLPYLLGLNGIYGSVIDSSVDSDAVEIDDNMYITAVDHFDSVTLTVTTDEGEYKFVLHNPSDETTIPAGAVVSSEGGSFTAYGEVPAGTEILIGEFNPTEGLLSKIPAGEADANTVWMDISLKAPGGESVHAGADAHVKTNIELPSAPEENGRKSRAVIKDAKLYHVVNEDEIEELPVKVETDGKYITALNFSTQSFSAFALYYTVDFHYGDYGFSIPGGTYIWLSDVFEELHYGHSTTEFKEVGFSDESLITVEYVVDEEDESNYDWRLTSLKPFSTFETLTLVALDGTVYYLEITDANDGSTGSEYVTDLSELLIPGSLKIYIDGEEVEDGAAVDVREGMLYDLTFSLKENAQKQFSNDEQMYFDLPEGFFLPENFSDSLTINLGLDGKVYGNRLSYDKDNNRLLLDWNKLDRKYQRLIAAGNLRFSLHLQGYIKPGQVNYGDGYKFIANLYDPHNASVVKTGVLDSSDLEHQKITYTVKVMSDGSTKNLTMTDIMGSALSYITEGGYPAVTWERESTVISQAEERRVETKAVGSAESADEPYIQNTAEGFIIHIPETRHGDVITFTYAAEVDYTKIARSGNATAEEMGNTAQIYGDDDPTDNKSVFHQKEVAYSDLVKSVSEPSARYTQGDREYQNLTWTIDTNSYKMISFRGSEITDRITVYEDSPDDPAIKNLPTYYAGEGITIEVYEYNQDKTSSVLKETRNIPWSELSTASDLDATKGFTYKVPEDDGIYEYKITYTTRSDVTGMTKNSDVHNTASSKGGTDEVSKLLHPKGNGLGVGKRVVNQTEDEVTWEISVYLNDIADGFNQRLVVEDLLPSKYLPSKEQGKPNVLYKESYIDGTLEIFGLQDGESYDFFASQPSGWWGDNNHVGWRDRNETWDKANWPLIRKEHRYESNNNNSFINNEDSRNVFFVEFFKDAEKSEQGLNAPANGGDTRTITIRFKTNINKEWRDRAWEYYGYEAVWNGLRHQNDVYANSAHENANVLVTGNYLVKSFKGKATWSNRNIYRFETYISGKSAGSTIVIDDYFDGGLWKLSVEDTPQFRAGTEPNYAKAAHGATSDEFWIAGEFGSSVEILGDGHVRFTIAEMPLKADGTAWPFYGVNYYLTPKDEEAWKKIQIQALDEGGIATFTNSAESEGMTDYDTYTVELLPEFKPVVKNTPENEDVKNNTVEYTIVLNGQKQRLNEGEPMTMEDEFENISVDYSTIKIVTDPAGLENKISYDFRGNVGYYEIPDETKVTITYTARLIHPEGTEWTRVGDAEEADIEVRNVASMLRWRDGGTSTLKVKREASADIYRIRMFKYGSGHMEHGLNGAVFGLYQNKLDENGEPIPELDGDGNIVNDMYGNIVYQKEPLINNKNEHIRFSTGTVWMLDGLIQSNLAGKSKEDIENMSDSILLDALIGDYSEGDILKVRQSLAELDGYADVQLSDALDGVHLQTGKDYYLKEETEPDGYAKDSSVDFYSFRFGEDPKYVNGVWQYFNNDILKIRNSPNDGAFGFKKVLAGNYELTDEQKNALSFTVQKKNGEEWETVNVEVPDLDENGAQKTDENGKPLYILVSALSYDQVKDGISVTHIGAGTFRIVEKTAEGAIPGKVIKTISFTRDEIEGDVTDEMQKGGYIEFEITRYDIENGLEHVFEITNSYNQALITLRAKKEWLNAENNPIIPEGASVTLGVFTVNKGVVSETPVQTVTLDGLKDVNGSNATGESASWTAQFAKLPKYDDDGIEIVYAVKEISGVDGYDVFYGSLDSNDAWLNLEVGGTGRVINRQETVSFTVSKIWTGSVPANADISIGIFYGATEQEAYAKYTSGAKAYKTASLPGENNGWVAEFESLPKADGEGREYVWIAVETKRQPGYDVNYPDEDKDYLVLSNDPTKLQSIANGPRPVTVDVTGTKVLIGKKLTENEFTFVLSPEASDAKKYSSGAYPGGFASVPARMTTKNNAEGTLVFHLNYSAEDYINAKTRGANAENEPCAYFYYVVEELTPLDANDNIEYDTAKFLVRVELTEDMKYELKTYNYANSIPEEALPAQSTLHTVMNLMDKYGDG